MAAAAYGVGAGFSVEFEGLFQQWRYKVFYGGRGGAKSWSFARALILLAYTGKKRILCTREFQSSIKDSVHKLIKDQISEMGLERWFEITDREIRCPLTGSEFIFKGIKMDPQGIKSTEGVDVCWVEEAHLVSKESWEVLIPTIRKESSEIWISFNPLGAEDHTYQRFVVAPPPSALVRRVNWDSNPWFPATLDAERRYMEANDQENYGHIWEGEPKVIGDAVIFKNKFVVDSFEMPHGTVPRFGIDWGFANDPLAAVKLYITGKWPREELWVEQESGGWGVEIDQTNTLLAKEIPEITKWPAYADSSRPETISYVNRFGINVTPAKKWPGSVDDGIEHLKAFSQIHIHQRCRHTAQEFRSYSWKTDRATGKILPVPVDANNHWIDAIRYGLDGFIQHRGVAQVWSRL